jgi:hypothetical protein
MKQLNIPNPPNPAGMAPLAWQRAVTDWMQRVKGVIQDVNNEATRPAGQQMRAENYTTNTLISGTTTDVADVANGLATLVDVLTQRGLISPTIRRNE